VDFDAKALFGNDDNPLPRLHLRGIKSNDRQQVYKFIEQWHNHLEANNVFDRITTLTNAPTETSPTEVELLDCLIGQGGDSAERSCRRRRAPVFTTHLAQLRVMKTITFGNTQSLKQGRNQTSIFQSRLQNHGIDLALANNPTSAYQQYKQICQEIKQQSAEQRTLRQTEQNVLIDRALNTGDRTKAQIISTIQKQEARRNTWQMLRFVRLRQTAIPQPSIVLKYRLRGQTTELFHHLTLETSRTLNPVLFGKQ
jgi:hypothetical protein